MEKFKKFLTQLVLGLILFVPFFDVISSYAIRNGTTFGTLNQLVKLLLIALLYIFFLSKKQKTYLFLAFSFLISTLLIKAYLFKFYHVENALIDLQQYMKLLFYPIAFWGFSSLLISEKTTKTFIKIVGVSFLFYIINAFLTFVGVGYSQYPEGGGLIGFFYSGNDFSLALLFQIALLWSVILHTKQLPLIVSFAIIAFLLGFFVGMKTLIFGIFILLTLGTLLISSTEYLPLLKKHLLKVILGFTFLFTLGVALLSSQGFFVRLQFHKDNGIISFLTSHRDKTASTALSVYSSLPVSEKIFGLGKSQEEKILGTYYNVDAKSVEMDPVDILLIGGLMVSIPLLFIWIVLFASSSSQTTSPEKRYAFLLFILLTILTIIVGHVLFAGSAVIYVTLLFAFLNKKDSPPLIVFVGAQSQGGIATYMNQTRKEAAKKAISLIVINSHYLQLSKTILHFPVVIAQLFALSFFSLLTPKRFIIHYHMAIKGSFIRKYFLAFLFWSLSDKQILHIHGGETPAFLSKILPLPTGKVALSLFLKLFHTIICVSPTLQHEVMVELDKFNVSYTKQNWLVIMNALELPTPLPTPLNYHGTEPFKLIFVGRLVAEKDLPTLLNIAEELKKRKLLFTLDIVGDGKLKSWLINEIDTRNLSTEVTYKGWLDHAEVMKMYSNYHGFIITSKQESFGLVVLEAYTAGLITFAIASGGLNDIVIEGKTGYLAKAESCKKIVNYFLGLLKKYKKIEQMQREAQSYVQTFGFAEHIEKLLLLWR